jgi:hypothetical protein
MITDQVILAGSDAYLQPPDAPGTVNLASSGTTTARTPDLDDGVQLDITALRLTIEAPNLAPLLSRTGGEERFLSITVMKELFPGLYADPYRNRVHTIAGFEDFTRGTFINCRAMEIDGQPVLVSTGTGQTRWTSPIYPTPTGTTFDAAAWDLAAARLPPADGFSYSLALAVWTGPGPSGAPATTLQLASGVDQAAIRCVEGLSSQFTDEITGNRLAVRAFQLEFTADVQQDAALSERDRLWVGTGELGMGESLGRPLLRAVHLLEPVKSCYDMAGLSELLRHCSDYTLFESTNGAMTHLSAALDLPVRLVRGSDLSEYLEVSVAGDRFTALEAMLDATVLIRAPRI